MTRTKAVPETVTLYVPFRVVKRDGRKEMHLPDGVRPDRKADNTLVKALARAFRWKRMLESGVRNARRIVVVGGGDVGCETAHMLVFELGKEVSVVERSANLMGSSCTANRGYLLRALSRQGVRLMPAARVTLLHAGGVDLVVGRSRAVPDPDAVWRPVLPPNTRNPFARRPEIAEVACALERKWSCSQLA